MNIRIVFRVWVGFYSPTLSRSLLDQSLYKDMPIKEQLIRNNMKVFPSDFDEFYVVV